MKIDSRLKIFSGTPIEVETAYNSFRKAIPDKHIYRIKTNVTSSGVIFMFVYHENQEK